MSFHNETWLCFLKLFVLFLFQTSVSEAFTTSGCPRCSLRKHSWNNSQLKSKEEKKRKLAWRGTKKQKFLTSDSNNENKSSTTSTSVTNGGGSRVNVRVRDIMNIITPRYSDIVVRNNVGARNGRGQIQADKGKNQKEWTKTRSYLYRTKQLTVKQVADVLSFLDDVFPNDPQLVKSIIQSSPRILRKNVKSYLKPTADFLLQFYGSDLFREAVKRNPNILLSTGVGYETDNGVSPIETFLIGTLEMKSNDLQKLKQTVPWIFQLSIEKLESHVLFWKDIINKGKGIEIQTKNIYYDDSFHAKKNDGDAGDNLIESALTSDMRKIIINLMLAHPTLFHLSVESNLKPRIQFLAEYCRLSDQDIATLLEGSRANILTLSVEDNLKPKVDYLMDILSPFSSLLSEKDDCDHYNIPRAEDIREANIMVIRKCLLKHPQLLCLSLNNLKSKVLYFDAIDDLINENEDSGRGNMRRSLTSSSLATRILLRSPVIYSLSLKENIVPKVQFLAGVWGTKSPRIKWRAAKNNTIEDSFIIVMDQSNRKKEDTSNAMDISTATVTFAASAQESLAFLLGEYPSILTLSLEGNIQPTINFYNRTGHIQLDEQWKLKETEVKSKNNDISSEVRGKGITANKQIGGRYIAASLFNRLLPRWHFLFAKQGHISPAQNLPQPSLNVLAIKNDAGFCDHLNLDSVEYKRFKKESVPRLKFSSQFDTWLKTGRPIDA